MQITIMAEEERYSNRQLERMLELQSADLMKHIDSATSPILEQVKKTNGRVTAAEADIVGYKIWRGWMTGGMAVIMIILPVVVGFLTWMVVQILGFGHQITNLSALVGTIIDQ